MAKEKLAVEDNVEIADVTVETVDVEGTNETIDTNEEASTEDVPEVETEEEIPEETQEKPEGEKEESEETVAEVETDQEIDEEEEAPAEDPQVDGVEEEVAVGDPTVGLAEKLHTNAKLYYTKGQREHAISNELYDDLKEQLREIDPDHAFFKSIRKRPATARKQRSINKSPHPKNTKRKHTKVPSLKVEDISTLVATEFILDTPSFIKKVMPQVRIAINIGKLSDEQVDDLLDEILGINEGIVVYYSDFNYVVLHVPYVLETVNDQQTAIKSEVVTNKVISVINARSKEWELEDSFNMRISMTLKVSLKDPESEERKKYPSGLGIVSVSDVKLANMKYRLRYQSYMDIGPSKTSEEYHGMIISYNILNQGDVFEDHDFEAPFVSSVKLVEYGINEFVEKDTRYPLPNMDIVETTIHNVNERASVVRIFWDFDSRTEENGKASRIKHIRLSPITTRIKKTESFTDKVDNIFKRYLETETFMGKAVLHDLFNVINGCVKGRRRKKTEDAR